MSVLLQTVVDQASDGVSLRRCFHKSSPSDPVGIGVAAPSTRLTAPAPAGARGLPKAVRARARLRRQTSSVVGGFCRNFELKPLGHNLVASKGVGSKMEEVVGAAGC